MPDLTVPLDPLGSWSAAAQPSALAVVPPGVTLPSAFPMSPQPAPAMESVPGGPSVPSAAPLAAPMALGPSSAPPLPVGPSLPGPPQPPGTQKGGWKDLAPLLAMIALAQKHGGGAAVQGVLHGYMQSQQARAQTAQTNYQNQRQSWNDQRDQASDLEVQRQRQETIDNQRLQQQQVAQTRFVTQLDAQLEAATSVEDADIVRDTMVPRAAALGLDAAAVKAYIAQRVNPTTLEQRAAETFLKNYKTGKSAELIQAAHGPGVVFQVKGLKRPMSLAELEAIAYGGGPTDAQGAPMSVSAAPKPDTNTTTRDIVVNEIGRAHV